MQDAVIRSKVLYGLESAELTQDILKKLDVFQLKGLRKILRLNTTFVDRFNTNKRVFEHANHQLPLQRRLRNPLKPYSEIYMDRKLQWVEQIITLPENDPLKTSTFKTNTLSAWVPVNRKPGGQKAKWATTAVNQYWEKVKHDLDSPYKHQEWQDTPNRSQQIRDAAA